MKFLNFAEELEDSDFKYLIVPVQYEGNVSYGSGAINGAKEIIEASYQLEYYDCELECEPCFAGMFTTDFMELENMSPERMVEDVKNKILKFKDKFFFVIGGDHSVGIPCVKAVQEMYDDDFSVLQFDAHPDLFYSWNESKFNHRCFGYYAKGSKSLVQVGIRSMDVDEADMIKRSEDITVVKPKDIRRIDWIKKVIDGLKSNNVFISIDVDAFDVSLFRNTGTPEPDGMLWHEVVDCLEEVFKSKNVVGCNLCEFAPVDNYKAEAYMLAKLIYKMIGLNEME